MRTESDLVTITVRIDRTLTLDLERLEQDPVWNQITDSLPDFQRAVEEYIQYHVSTERFPYHMPSTNGPGEPTMTGLEILCPPQSL